MNKKYIFLISAPGDFTAGGFERLEAWLDAHESFAAVCCDHEFISDDGVAVRTNVPNYSPLRQACQLVSGPVLVVRAEVAERFGEVPDGLAGSALFALRLALGGATIGRDPSTLFCWRGAVGAVEPDAVNRELAAADVSYRVRVDTNPWALRLQPMAIERPRVSIIIPTRGSAGQVFGTTRTWVMSALESLRACTYDTFDIVVVGDADTPSDVVAAASALDNVTWVTFDEPFHFGRKCNVGAFWSSGEILIFLNDDIEVISPNWIESLVDVLSIDGVGVASPMLLFEDGTIQHGGHIHEGGFAVQGGLGQRPDDTDDGAMLQTEREVAGVSGACLAIRADLFGEVGGFFDGFPTSFSDDDLCLKVRATGKSIVWTPHSRLFHFETKTRVATIEPAEAFRARDRWPGAYYTDPIWNVQ